MVDQLGQTKQLEIGDRRYVTFNNTLYSFYLSYLRFSLAECLGDPDGAYAPATVAATSSC